MVTEYKAISQEDEAKKRKLENDDAFKEEEESGQDIRYLLLHDMLVGLIICFPTLFVVMPARKILVVLPQLLYLSVTISYLTFLH